MSSNYISLVNILSTGYKMLFESANNSNLHVDLKSLNNPLIDSSVKILKIITSMGYDAYIVGGAARDILMKNKSVNDIDISTNMPMDVIKSTFDWFSNNGEKHGTLVVRMDGEEFELTQFRHDGEYTDSRRPDSVNFVDSFELDASRRDLTINAIGIDVNGNVLDFHGGIDDINNKRIRTVGDAESRFSEDYLRIIRAIRFAARFNYAMDDDVVKYIKENGYKIVDNVSRERISNEILKMSKDGIDSLRRGIYILIELGLFELIFGINNTSKIFDTINKIDIPSIPILYSIIYNDLDSSTIKDILKNKLVASNELINSVIYLVKYTTNNAVNIFKSKPIDILLLSNNPNFDDLLYLLDVIGNTNAVQYIEKVSNTFSNLPQIIKHVNSKLSTLGYKGISFRNSQLEILNQIYSNNINDIESVNGILNDFGG